MQLTHASDLPVFQEIINESDRGAAVVAVGFVETKLFAAVKACLRDNKDVTHRLLTGAGPLAPLSHKIDMAYLLGLFRDETRKDFHLIREIRNRFAHEPEPHSFDTPFVKTRCEKLTIIDRVWPKEFHEVRSPRPLDRETARREYLESLSLLWNFLDHQSKHEKFRKRAEELLPY